MIEEEGCMIDGTFLPLEEYGIIGCKECECLDVDDYECQSLCEDLPHVDCRTDQQRKSGPQNVSKDCTCPNGEYCEDNGMLRTGFRSDF